MTPETPARGETRSYEERARELLDRAGVPDVATYTSGDLVELANLLMEFDARTRERDLAILRGIPASLLEPLRREFGAEVQRQVAEIARLKDEVEQRSWACAHKFAEDADVLCRLDDLLERAETAEAERDTLKAALREIERHASACKQFMDKSVELGGRVAYESAAYAEGQGSALAKVKAMVKKALADPAEETR